MIPLVVGYNAMRWQRPTQAIRALPWLALINRIYTRNPSTTTGYIGYTKDDLYPTLTTLDPDVDYLVDMLGTYDLMGAAPAPAGSFAAFTGYVPAVPAAPTAPVTNTGPGFVATGTAANPITAGMLVARILDGLVPYSARTLKYQHLLFGVALNSAAPGQAVNVQRGGYVLVPGYNLPTTGTLFAGDEGALVSTNIGMAFSQVVGRALNADSFVYQPEAITLLIPNNLALQENGN